MADQYVSKFSGVQIDAAVAYYNAIEQAGRKIITVGINEDAWKGLSKPYSLKITLSGVYNVAGATTSSTSNTEIPSPIVYFLSDDNKRWDLDYDYKYENGVGTITCYSNLKISGNMIIVTVLSNGGKATLSQ